MNFNFQPYGIYVHAPWCKRRCPYCSFTVYVDKEPPFDCWLSTIKRDWQRLQPHYPGSALSLYIGGGTPSLLPNHIIAALIDFLPLQDNAEVTIELNPDDVSQEKIDKLMVSGVTRLSVGIQSLQSSTARSLGRGHNVQQSRSALEIISKSAIQSWSVDMIFGVPEQSLQAMRQDLHDFLSYQPPHISIYGLTFEPDTAFERARVAGRLKELDEGIWAEQFRCIMQQLKRNGYDQYEVSNFAKKHHRSKHNEQIWKNGFYAGLGPSAHGFLPDGRRSVQPASWNLWQSCQSASFDTPTIKQAAVDFLLTSIRHQDGINQEHLQSRFGYTLNNAELDTLQRNGFIHQQGPHITLTDQGYFMVDGITAQLYHALHPPQDIHSA